jgi:hypothetical protein
MYQIGDKKCDANFELIKGTRCSASGSQYDYVRAIYVRAIPDLFIPYINDVMPMHQQLPTNNSLIEPVFDPHQLCFTEITHTTVKVTYLLPPKLIAMLHFLQNKIDRGNPKVLADTLAIKCYYENNATWHTQCSNILEHVSPYIREKLEEPEENNSSFATSLSSLGWCTIS